VWLAAAGTLCVHAPLRICLRACAGVCTEGSTQLHPVHLPSREEHSMLRRLTRVAIAAVLTALATCACATLATAQSAPSSESDNPIADQGSSYHYRSYITGVTPRVPNLSVEVLEFADRLVLRNHTGKTVTVYGYSGEPYARVQPDGTTEQNVRSPAVYLNTSFYANVTVPPSASATAAPKWVMVDRTGQFEWHDHRIHWMSPVTPPQVKDTSKRTKIFSWSVPIEVGAQRGAIHGELFWVPESSKTPTAAIVALIAIVLLSFALVLFVRNRRARGDPPESSSRPGDAQPPGREAW
jgi:hypothetical protein